VLVDFWTLTCINWERYATIQAEAGGGAQDSLPARR
jgi:hypothetical protein